ncbi:HbrB-like protein [Patellaria atrata CBS 101060]|uniref:HbrB-like protein n=1 Tax=Patellaria atrata CBS 101060 TaxID=1346257 RepID=A0A9P4SBL5_9PEZI|nr:HbrB-like protein [Patellaria atrata CBS 101060]
MNPKPKSTSPSKALKSPITFSANSTSGTQSPSIQTRHRAASTDDSESSDSSQLTPLSIPRAPYIHPPSSRGSPSSNTGTPPRSSNDLPLRANSPAVPQGSHIGHRPRQHSQGFFEPTLPSTSAASPSQMSNLTASQIAAQAAMHVQNNQHMRKRSQTIPEPGATHAPPTSRRHPPSNATSPPLPSQQSLAPGSNSGLQYQNGIVGGHRVAATAAANVVFPRSPLHSPGLQAGSEPPIQTHSPAPDKEQKHGKEKSKMKLFHKPKGISISKEKSEFDKRHPALPSPNKMGMQSTGALSRMMMNASTTSLADPTMSGASSMYSSANASTSTLVPIDRAATFAVEKEKEKHKHHFLSRQKKRDKEEHHHLPLSSASSTSKPTDPNAPHPLYSFAAPSSPGHGSSFAKSVSGFDLRHGGRALREKKKEEKAASALGPSSSNLSIETAHRERNPSFSTDRSDWPGAGSLGSAGGSYNQPSSYPLEQSMSQHNAASVGATFGLPGMTPDDAWPLLKARLLNIFEGEEPRPPIEDFNALVSVHIRRCVQRRAPTIIIEDLNELLNTGFSSLDQTLRRVPDDRLIPHLVEMWLVVFTTILPFLQAVFLPLDLEFKGRGSIMGPREAADFWGGTLPESDGSNGNIPSLGESLDVRRITLITFRDTVILPRNDTLVAIFSRLSLDNLSAGLNEDPRNGATVTSVRPGTAHSTDPTPSSFNSQASTLLDSGANSSGPSLGARSRATSNTSAGSFHSIGSPPPPLPGPAPMDSAKVTEMVGRMLQCVSVLASVQSGDESQVKMERLTKELKHNWLGRGRTGRQRQGFVGTRLPRGQTGMGAGVL